MAAGRNPKHNADYFPHANGMRDDKKLKAVRAKFGLSGYAIYNMILESLAESNLIILEWDDLEIEMLSGDFGIDSEKLIQMVDYFCAVNLLQRNNGYLFCRQLDERLKPIFDKRKSDLCYLRSEKGINVTEIKDSEAKIELSSRDRKEKKRKEKESKEKNNNSELFSPPVDEESSTPNCPHKEIIALYHRILPAHRKVQVWQGVREKMLRARWNEEESRQNLKWWESYFKKVKSSSFLTGKTDKPFMPDLEWLVRPNNICKVLEGKYDDNSMYALEEDESDKKLKAWREQQARN